MTLDGDFYQVAHLLSYHQHDVISIEIKFRLVIYD